MRGGGKGARAEGCIALAAICLLALLLISPPAWSNTYTVTTGGDDAGTTPCTGGGGAFSCNTLRDAIVTANGAGGANTIDFSSSVTAVTLTSNLTALNLSGSGASTTINGGTSSGGSVAINGGGNTVFFVVTGSAVFDNLTVSGATASGGAGSSSGGGGGLGAGGGLFVANGATVTTNNVAFASNSATGGTGATGAAATPGGNGGGLNGGTGGGGGSPTGAGGAGGFGGGGGGGNSGAGGAGGFGGGGGGGSTGGAGGFAGGSGGGSTSNGGGGGGGALGGAIMVGPGGALNVDGTLSVSGNSVTAGAGGLGGANGTAGGAYGAGIFLSGNGTLVLNPGSGQTQTISDSIADQTGSGGTGANAGSWGLQLMGAGTVVLGGANAYTGATTIGGGTLALSGNGSIATSSGVSLAASGAIFDISGVTGFASINGLTGVSGSTVNLGGNELAVDQTGSATFSGAVAGTSTSSLVFEGTGTETLNGASTSTGSLEVDGGTVSLGAGASIATFGSVDLESGTLDISNGGNQTVQNLSSAFGGSVTLGSNTLTDSTTSAGSFDGVISGTGGLTVAGSGSLTLFGANTYTGATTINGGTLAIGFGGSIATSSGVDLAGPSAIFELANDGTATIQDLTGVSGSSVAIGFNTLAFGTANSTSFAGSFSGAGELLKEGTGTLTLTGNSSAFDGTTIVSAGGLDIAPTSTSGGSLGGSVTVENGAFVVGHGTIGGSLTNVGGIVASLGAAVPLSVSGSYTQNSGGTLEVGLSPAAATRLAVSGSASLAGTLNIQAVPGNTGYVPFTSYVILNTTTGDVSGTFTQVTGALPVLPISIDYLAKSVDVVLGGFTGATPNEQAVAKSLNGAFSTATGDFAAVLDLAVNLPTGEMHQALSSFGGQIYDNLATVSLQDRRLFLGAMDSRLRLLSDDSPSAAELGNLGGGIPMAWGSGPNALQVAALGDAINDPVGLAVSGTSTDATPAPGATSIYAPAPPPPYAAAQSPPTGDIINDPVGIAASQMPAPPPPTRSWAAGTGNLWARGFGQFGNIGNGGGALGASYTTGGGAIGADLIHTPQSLFGIAAGGGQSNVSLNDNPETGTISFVQLGVYGAQAIGDGFVVDGAGIYSHDFYDVTRGIYLPGTSRVATSSHGGDDEVLDVGLSHPYNAAGWQVTPRAGLSYYHIGQSSFSESGANSLDLAVDPNALNALFSRIGIAFAQPMTLGETHIVPEFRGAWLHNFVNAQSSYNATFIGTTAASFAQNGVPIGRDAVDFGVGLGFALPQTAFPGELSGFLQYDATLAVHEMVSSIAAGVRYKW